MDESAKKKTTLSIASDRDGLIPKTATNVAISRTGNDNYIFTFISQLPDEPANLVSRISLEKGTVKDLLRIVKELGEKKLGE